MPIHPGRLERARAESNLGLATHVRTLARGRNSASLEVGGGSVIYAWPGALFNAAVGLGWADTPPDRDLDAVEAFFAARGEPAQVALADCVPSAWRQLLYTRGYGLRDLLYVWERDMGPGDEAGAGPDPRIERVAAADVELWARTVATGFADGAPQSEGDIDIARAIAGRPGIVLFLGRHEGRPAAAGAVSLHDGVAELFSGSTLPLARRTGLQTALIRARLAYARERGARTATVQTDPGGASRRNVERAGFTMAYTTLEFRQRT